MSGPRAVCRGGRARNELEFLPFSIIVRKSDSAEYYFGSIFNLAQQQNGFQGGTVQPIDLYAGLFGGDQTSRRDETHEFGARIGELCWIDRGWGSDNRLKARFGIGGGQDARADVPSEIGE